MPVREVLLLGNPKLYEVCAMMLEGDLSELLQHECDHLDGILTVSRAVDPYSFALRSQKHFLK